MNHTHANTLVNHYHVARTHMRYKKKVQRIGDKEEEEENDKEVRGQVRHRGMMYTFVPSGGLWMTVV